MANKKLPGGRKSAGRVSTSAKKLVSLKAGAVGVAISELPAVDELTGNELFPVVQEKETRSATLEQIKYLIPAGETGASAYEVWANAQPEGADKSESAYLEYMRGKPGKEGESGADGLSAYQIWADAQEAGADKSEQAYLQFQEGKKGDAGKSAYQLWLDGGNEGTEEDYQNWLRASFTVEGLSVRNGNIYLTSKVLTTVIDKKTEIKPALNAYINDNHYFKVNGNTLTIDLSEWDMSFNTRQNLRFLCVSDSSGTIKIKVNGGNIYRPNGSLGAPEVIMVTSEPAVYEITQDLSGEYLRLNQLAPQVGTHGASAYDIWASAQPEGSDTSEAAYLHSMQGKPGEKGADGLSAYQIWLNAGNQGTEDDFLEWLQVNASVEVDPKKTNLVKNNADGLFVDGTHPIIPKFSSSTLNGMLDTFKSMTDGTRIYTMAVDLKNPLGVSSLGGVGINRYIAAEPQYFFTDENGKYIPAQYFISAATISASTITTTISVIMSNKPYRSWELSTLEPVAVAEEGVPLQCKVLMRLLAGTTPSQNGMS
ncbi:hypothetical protein [Enterobacter ludwigii]|uniref:hypothetical protein n=1 Tax=Enterobacter ludwigii TaxID=299767 RepID=UPI001E4CB361|nr:hypothetical protein [Enterobacter ludwigii]MCE1916585.1 hypothetical protein [Enterobacter ludwigii]